MSSSIGAPTFTYQLTSANGDSNSGSITIQTGYGVKKVSIICNTNTACTVLGTGKWGALSSSALSLGRNEDMQILTIIANDGDVLSGITITSPSGATANIVGN